MADTKISALPAATTPLAGTELAAIVQSGTTKSVAVGDIGVGNPYGIMFAHEGTDTQDFNTTHAKMDQWLEDGLSSDTTPDSTTNNRITVNADGIYLVQAQLSFEGANLATFHAHIYKSGVDTEFSASRKMGTGGDVGSVSIFGMLSMVATDYVEIWIASETGGAGASFDLVDGQLVVTGI